MLSAIGRERRHSILKIPSRQGDRKLQIKSDVAFPKWRSGEQGMTDVGCASSLDDEAKGFRSRLEGAERELGRVVPYSTLKGILWTLQDSW